MSSEINAQNTQKNSNNTSHGIRILIAVILIILCCIYNITIATTFNSISSKGAGTYRYNAKFTFQDDTKILPVTVVKYNDNTVRCTQIYSSYYFNTYDKCDFYLESNGKTRIDIDSNQTIFFELTNEELVFEGFYLVPAEYDDSSTIIVALIIVILTFYIIGEIMQMKNNHPKSNQLYATSSEHKTKATPVQKQKVVIKEKKDYRGLHRHSKEMDKMYNGIKDKLPYFSRKDFERIDDIMTINEEMGKKFALEEFATFASEKEQEDRILAAMVIPVFAEDLYIFSVASEEESRTLADDYFKRLSFAKHHTADLYEEKQKIDNEIPKIMESPNELSINATQNSIETNDVEKWIEKAANLGDKDAQYKMAIISKSKKDFNEAVRWYECAAKNGSAEAQFELAELYSTNGLLGLDEEKAKDLYKRAAAQGYKEAINKVRFYDS